MQFSMTLVVLASLLKPSRGNAFLSVQLSGMDEQPQQDILELLERELGSNHNRTDERRVAELQEELSHTFASLPKGSNGTLQAAGARYALHRLFVQRHAWQLSGLDPRGQTWSSGLASDAFGNRFPDAVRTFFEERLGERGVSLHELAVLAALLESMTHNEISDRLRVTLQAFNISASSTLELETATSVLHTYMASYVLGVPLSKLTPRNIRTHVSLVKRNYPTWSDTAAFVDGIRDTVLTGATEADFNLLGEILARVADQYGRWQSKECSALKSTLVKMESRPGSGRVRLGDFYHSALTGENWQFSESIGYLRVLGALDEAPGGEPSVIIPNYIGSPSNCVASSGYYSVCCIDECEELMDHLELELQAPTATTKDITRVLSTQTSFGNGTLSSALLGKLEEVAEHHDGVVPLHGRLMAQWLHLAYPRECPFPHVSGTTNPLRVEEFMQTGAEIAATPEEMQHFAEASSKRTPEQDPEDGLCSTMWTPEEELVDPVAHAAHQEVQRTSRSPWAVVLRGIAFFAAAATVSLSLMRLALSSAAAASEQGGADKALFLGSPSLSYSV